MFKDYNVLLNDDNHRNPALENKDEINCKAKQSTVHL